MFKKLKQFELILKKNLYILSCCTGKHSLYVAVHVVGFVGRYHIPIVYIVNIDVGLFEAKGFSDNKLEEFSVITFG